jgi:PAS domain S-box-containing protein
VKALGEELRYLGACLNRTLEQGALPLSLFDSNGICRWINTSMRALVGDVTGRRFVRFTAPEHVHLARQQFARKLIGEAQVTDYNLTLLDQAGGRVPVRIHSMPLRSEESVVGVLSFASPVERGSENSSPEPQLTRAPELTARQREVLQLLGDGIGTSDIATQLGVTDQTARNHINALLRELGVHSRLEAVVAGYRLGILSTPTNTAQPGPVCSSPSSPSVAPSRRVSRKE